MTGDDRLQELVAAYLAAVERGESPDRAALVTNHPELAGELRAFFADHETLRIKRAHHFPEATAANHIARMIEMITTLIARGHAYRADDGSVYFRISSFPAYGRLAHLNLDELRPSGRVSRTSARRATPPPASPGTGVPSRRTSHQQSSRASSGTVASSRSASASASGSSASSSRRSSLATTRAANRQNRQVPE